VYRPGDSVHVGAIVRLGPVGAFRPSTGRDRFRIVVRRNGDDPLLSDSTVVPSVSGLLDATVVTGPSAPLGHYSVSAEYQWQGEWVALGETSIQIAEYRAAEYTVSVVADTTGIVYPGDTVRAQVGARYLYGAPMRGTIAKWTAQLAEQSPWAFHIPGYQGWAVGSDPSIPRWGFPREDRFVASGQDTLGAGGFTTVRVALPSDALSRPGLLTIESSVADASRQAIAARATVRVDPAQFYIAARVPGEGFMHVDSAQLVQVRTVRANGTEVRGATIDAVVVRRPEPEPADEKQAGDTVARCRTETSEGDGHCTFTPRDAGVYDITLRARDSAGRLVVTSFSRWAAGRIGGWAALWTGWDRQYRLALAADRRRYSVGDTAQILVTSPFDSADAWVTVERESVLEQWHQRVTKGATTLRVPVHESHVPNVFVGVVLVRGRVAAPGDSADPGAPALRAGYVSLGVNPDVKRLVVGISPDAPHYQPRDSARISVRVRDGQGVGVRADVILWAADEGVLSLTGFDTPDPVTLLYREGGIGARLWSSLTTLAEQRSGVRARLGVEQVRGPIGSGRLGLETEPFGVLLRSHFAGTAFFLARLRTDSAGHVEAHVRLPDNLTTYRVIAVAATTGDRYGAGDAPLLVTQALIARPALPRFVRPGDTFAAGPEVSRRDGASVHVRVHARVSGADLGGDTVQTALLEPGHGRAVPFNIAVSARERDGSTAVLQFEADDGHDADAVQVALPIRPVYHPRAWTAVGRLVDSVAVTMALPGGLDPARSRLVLNLGTSPLSVVRGIGRTLHVYPYYCTEQVVSTALPLLALWRARRVFGDSIAPADAGQQLATAVATIARRQRSDGGIGYWGAEDWSSEWLSAYAGGFLLDARDAGIPVDGAVLARLQVYLRDGLPDAVRDSVPRWRWREEVAALDFLSAFGSPDRDREMAAWQARTEMTLEDRARLAEVLLHHADTADGRVLMDEIWASVRVEGRRAVIEDSMASGWGYFPSHVRLVARILHATLAADASNPLIGPLSEALIQHARAGNWWNTQDYAFAVWGLAGFTDAEQTTLPRTIVLRQGARAILETSARPADGGQVSLPLTGLLHRSASRGSTLAMTLAARERGPATFFYLTVDEVPINRPTHPDVRGLAVERWYERYEDHTPIVSAVAGDLVRVRLRVTVPVSRQFVLVDDALPAGLEAVNVDLRTTATLPAAKPDEPADSADKEVSDGRSWWSRSWWWWREFRDDRVVFSAPELHAGTYLLSYVARATTPGTFIAPPANAQEVYNPAVHGRSDGGVFHIADETVHPR
jgi:uncharacterized protein YfaS (alpha-2-macroglobulin family)